MSLTLPTAYSDRLKRPFRENWLVQCFYDSTNFTGFSFFDTKLAGKQYYGHLSGSPTIREAISLQKSKASYNNISLSLNNFNFEGNPISEELLFGTNYYINKTVKIFSFLDDGQKADFGDITTTFVAETRTFSEIGGAKVQIYEGRLESVQHTADKVKLNIVEYRPFKDITIANTKTTEGVYYPVVYGDYTKNSSTSGSPAFIYNNNDFWPMPRNVEDDQDAEALAPAEYQITSNANPHFYDDNLKQFLPLETSAGNEMATQSDSYQSGDNAGYKVSYDRFLRHTFKIKPVSATGSDGYKSNGNCSINTSSANYANAIDNSNSDDTTTRSFIDITTQNNSTTPGSAEFVYTFTPPEIKGELISFKLKVTYAIDVTTLNSSTLSVILYNDTYKNFDYTAEQTTGEETLRSHLAAAPLDSADDLATTSTLQNGTELTNEMVFNQYYSEDGRGFPDEIKLRWKQETPGHGASTNTDIARVSIYDVQMICTVKIPTTEKWDYLYCGADGYAKSWSSGTCTDIHDFHRDMMIRFGGWTTDDPYQWSNLESAKGSTWQGRFWLTEPMDLEKALEKLQYEGGFIFKKRADGTGRYIWMYNSPTANHTLTSADVDNITIRHTSFTDIESKQIVNYEKHPAEDKYASSSTLTNATTRTNYNIVDGYENIKEINLDALALTPGSGDVEGNATNLNFGSYYNTILGGVSLIVGGKIRNPEIAYKAEVGDVISFSSAPSTKAFGSAWSGKLFIITKIQRKIGETSFEAFEIRKTGGLAIGSP